MLVRLNDWWSQDCKLIFKWKESAQALALALTYLAGIWRAALPTRHYNGKNQVERHFRRELQILAGALDWSTVITIHARCQDPYKDKLYTWRDPRCKQRRQVCTPLSWHGFQAHPPQYIQDSTMGWMESERYAQSKKRRPNDQRAALTHSEPSLKIYSEDKKSMQRQLIETIQPGSGRQISAHSVHIKDKTT